MKRWLPWAVWTLRIFVGAVFVASGLAKMADLWGFTFKIEEYLAVWNWTQPRSVVVLAAMVVSAWEFLFGLLLALGCYRRAAPWALMLTMAAMLPLTAYLAVADPVEDCGCFGDLWHISNTATFLKNVVLTGALGLLIAWNAKVKSQAFRPAIQWIVAVWSGIYIIIIGLYGYNIQPMLDFRSFPVGTELSGDDSDFTVFDADGEDVSSEAVVSDGPQWLLVIPELRRADISYTYYINELANYADSCGIAFAGIIGSGRRGLDRWRDLSMAEYPLFSADDTQLKELARGTQSLVLLKDGKVASKITVTAIDPDELEAGMAAGNPMAAMTVDPWNKFLELSAVFGGFLLLLGLFQGVVLVVNAKIRRAYRRKMNKAEPTGPSIP